MLLIIACVLFASIVNEYNYQSKVYSQSVREIAAELKDQIPPELRDRAIIFSENSFGITGPLTEDELKFLEEYTKKTDKMGGIFYPEATGEITTYCSDRGNLTVKTYIHGEKPILYPLEIRSNGYTTVTFEPAPGYSFQNLQVGTGVNAGGIGISVSIPSGTNVRSTSTGFLQSIMLPENVCYAKLGYEGFSVIGLTGRPVIDQTGSASIRIGDNDYLTMKKVTIW